MKTDRKTPGRKVTYFRLRMDEATRKKLKVDASAAGLSQSEYLRRLILKNRVSSKSQRKQVDNLIYDLNRIGNNVNQIAHKMNEGYYPASAYEDMIKMGEDINGKIKDIIFLWNQ